MNLSNTQTNQEIYVRATFSDRMMATAVDDIVFGGPMRIVNGILSGIFLPLHFLNYSVTLYYLFVPIAYFLYFCYYTYINQGQTLGKSWFNIRIATLDGNTPSLAHLVLRSIVKDGFLVLGLILSKWGGVLWMATYLFALSKERRALHDIISRTQVVRVKDV